MQFTGSSGVERRAVNPRLRRFDSCPVSRWLAGPHGEGSGLQNRRARFDPGASLSQQTALSANGQATRLSIWERRVQLPPASHAPFDLREVPGPSSRRGGFDTRTGYCKRLQRLAVAQTVSWGRGSVAERALDKRKTLVRLHPSLHMAAVDQWQVSGLWPREAKASREFDSLRSPRCLVVPLVKVSGCLPGETGPIPVRGARCRSGRRGQGARLKPGRCWFDSSGRHSREGVFHSSKLQVRLLPRASKGS